MELIGLYAEDTNRDCLRECETVLWLEENFARKRGRQARGVVIKVLGVEVVLVVVVGVLGWVCGYW